MTSEDDPQLSAWISARLRVIAIPVSDADELGHAETCVLDALDPPFNLLGRPPSPVRTRLTELRRDRRLSAGVRSAEQRPRPRAQLPK